MIFHRLRSLPFILVLLGVALILRALYFFHESPSFFEISVFDALKLPFSQYVLGKEIGLVPPVYYGPAHLISQFGSAAWFPRILSLVMGLFAPFALYFVALRMYGSVRLAWCAALLLAVNPYHVAVSCAMTPDAMGVAATCVLLWLFLRTLAGGRRLDWLAYVVGGFVLIHTHAGAPWVLASLCVCHLFYAVRVYDASATRLHRVERVVFYYFVLATLCAPWRIRMDSWVPWDVGYAEFSATARSLFHVPFWGVAQPHVGAIMYAQCFLIVCCAIALPRALRTVPYAVVPFVGCAMVFAACYGYVQIDRTYFMVERDAPLVLPFVILAIVALCASVPVRMFRTFVFWGFLGLFGVVSVLLPSMKSGVPWREIARTVEMNASPTTVAAFWPNYTARFATYELLPGKVDVVSATQLLSDLNEPERERDVLFVITESPYETPRTDENLLYGWSGVLASHSTATLVWREGPNMIIRAQDLDWPWVRTWATNPVKYALRDAPLPGLTEFHFTPSNLMANGLEDDPGVVFNQDGFAWQNSALAYDFDGRRVVWTMRPSVELELPVMLYPGKYQVCLTVGSQLRRFADDTAQTKRTIDVRLAVGERETSATIDARTMLALPITVTTETVSLPMKLSSSPMLETNTPNGLALGMKISSIRIDRIDENAQE